MESNFDEVVDVKAVLRLAQAWMAYVFLQDVAVYDFAAAEDGVIARGLDQRSPSCFQTHRHKVLHASHLAS